MSRGLRPVAGMVDRLLRGLRLATEVDRVAATRVWRGAAASVLGPDAVETRALRVDETTLVVAVPSPSWAAEIRLREADLLEAVNAASPRSGITAIRSVPASGGPATPRSSAGGTTAP